MINSFRQNVGRKLKDATSSFTLLWTFFTDTASARWVIRLLDSDSRFPDSKSLVESRFRPVGGDGLEFLRITKYSTVFKRAFKVWRHHCKAIHRKISGNVMMLEYTKKSEGSTKRSVFFLLQMLYEKYEALIYYMHIVVALLLLLPGFLGEFCSHFRPWIRSQNYALLSTSVQEKIFDSPPFKLWMMHIPKTHNELVGVRRCSNRTVRRRWWCPNWWVFFKCTFVSKRVVVTWDLSITFSYIALSLINYWIRLHDSSIKINLSFSSICYRLRHATRAKHTFLVAQLWAALSQREMRNSLALVPSLLQCYAAK